MKKSQLVLVFKDLKNNRWTLWTPDRKTHLGYRKRLNLKNCKLIVITSSRRKILKTRKRFPHAWIIGHLSSYKRLSNEIKYNPFISSNFQSNDKIIRTAKEISFNEKSQCFY